MPREMAARKPEAPSAAVGSNYSAVGWRRGSMHCCPATRVERATMRLSVVTFLRPGTEPRDRPLGRIVDYARRIERRGFPGIWVTDSLGRGRPTPHPLGPPRFPPPATARLKPPTALLHLSLP